MIKLNMGSKRKYLLILIFGCVWMGMVKGVEATNKKIFVQYHMWYTKEDEFFDGDRWNSWDRCGWGVKDEYCNSPDKFLNLWRRETSSRLGLPITGYYSTKIDLDVVEYQFRLMKQAGIDGVFVSVYDGRWWPTFENILKIAEKTGVKVGVELYGGVGWDRDPWQNYIYPMKSNNCTTSRNWEVAQMTDAIKRYKNSSAGLRIDGKPAIWIANYPSGVEESKNKWQSWYPASDCVAPEKIYNWGNVDQLGETLNKVKQNLGEDIYVVMIGGAKDNTGKNFASLNQMGRIAGHSNISQFWSLFGYNNQISVNLGSTDRTKFESNYRALLDRGIAESGGKFAAHMYAGFDERGLFPTEDDVDRLSGIKIPRAVINRDGNGMYDSSDGFLKASLLMASEKDLWVMFESWNDWNEQTQIEPGFSFANYSKYGDYFSAIRRVAEYKGLSNVNFLLPDKKILDEALINNCRYKELEGKKIKLIGALGFDDNDGCGDGVELAVYTIDDDKSYLNPSYLPSTKLVRNIKINKERSGVLKTFEIDLTKIIDKDKILFGIDSKTNTNCDNTFFSKLELNWYGEKIDLMTTYGVAKWKWQSGKGNVSWPSFSQTGSAGFVNDKKLEDGVVYKKTLNLHPNWETGGYVWGEINWFSLQEKIKATCEEETIMINEEEITTEESSCVVTDGDIADLIAWYESFRNKTYGVSGDLNCDSVVDIKDLTDWYGVYRNK